MVICWEMARIRNENVSTIPLVKAEFKLKLSCITPCAFVSMRGITTNPHIFTSTITAGVDRHLEGAS